MKLSLLENKPFPVGFEWDSPRGVLIVGYEDESFEFPLLGSAGFIAKFVEDYAVESQVGEIHFEVGGLREVIERVTIENLGDRWEIALEGKKKSVYIDLEDVV